MSPTGFAKALGCLGLLMGCGDPLATADYKGEALFSLGGTVLDESGGDLPADALRVTILWERPDATVAPYEPSITVETTFPARYQLTLFSPPADSAMQSAPWGGSVVMGVPVLYQDGDGDDTFSGDPDVDPIVGGTDEVLLLYTDTAAEPPADDPELPALAKGFSALELMGDPCEPDLSEPALVDEADVALRIAAGLSYQPPLGCEGRGPRD